MLPSTVKCSCELSCLGKLSSDSPSANTNIWIHFNLTKEDLHLNHVICSSRDGTKVWLNNYTALKIKALPRRRLYIYVTSITIKSNSGFSLLFFVFFSLQFKETIKSLFMPVTFLLPRLISSVDWCWWMWLQLYVAHRLSSGERWQCCDSLGCFKQHCAPAYLIRTSCQAYFVSLVF